MAKPKEITVSEMEAFFKEVDFTDDVIELNQCTVVLDIQKFVKTHINALKSNSGKRIFIPYYNRLVQVYKMYTNNSMK